MIFRISTFHFLEKVMAEAKTKPQAKSKGKKVTKVVRKKSAVKKAVRKVRAKKPVTTAINQLLSGNMDSGRHEYEFGGAFFKKVPSGLNSLTCVAIEFVMAYDGHLLQNVKKGTIIPCSLIAKEMFSAKGLPVDQHLSRLVLWKFFRGLIGSKGGTVTVVKAVEPPATKKPIASESAQTVLAPTVVKASKPSGIEMIWNGTPGRAVVQNMDFRVSDTIVNGRQFNAVYFWGETQKGTPLTGIPRGTCLEIRTVRCLDEYRSKAFDKKAVDETRMFEVLRGLFKEAGHIKKPQPKKQAVKPVAKPAQVTTEVPVPAVSKVEPDARKPLVTLAMIGIMAEPGVKEKSYQGSTDIGKLLLGSLGDYVVGNVGERVMVKVSRRPGNFIEVKIIRSEEGSTLNGKCKDGTTIAHKWLGMAPAEVMIPGENAEHKSALYSFLKEAISGSKGESSTPDHGVKEGTSASGNLYAPQYGIRKDVHPQHPTAQ